MLNNPEPHGSKSFIFPNSTMLQAAAVIGLVPSVCMPGICRDLPVKSWGLPGCLSPLHFKRSKTAEQIAGI